VIMNEGGKDRTEAPVMASKMNSIESDYGLSRDSRFSATADSDPDADKII
jgi:hypothetical protein